MADTSTTAATTIGAVTLYSTHYTTTGIRSFNQLSTTNTGVSITPITTID